MKKILMLMLCALPFNLFAQVHSDDASWAHVKSLMATCSAIIDVADTAAKNGAYLNAIKTKRNGSAKSVAELQTQFTNARPGATVTSDQLADADDARVVLSELEVWLDEDPDGGGPRGTRRSDCERWQM